MLPDIDDDEFTQLTDVNTPRADMVGQPAHGWPGWLVMKQDAEGALLDPEFVRDLLSKNTEQEAPVPQATDAGETTLPNGITLKGSPAAMAAFIHASSVRKQEQRAEDEPGDGDVAKADMSAKSINDLDDSDFAYIEPGGKKDDEGKTTPRSLRHFPVNDAAHVRNALSRAPQSPFGEKAMPKIKARAKALGIDVAKEAGVAEPVTKDMMDAAGDAMPLDDGEDGLDPTVPLAMPEEMAPGDPTDPGSPAWESVDAATAMKWTTILARAGAAISMMADREMLEAASADPSDAENAMDLQDVRCAIDYAISVLAPFAVSEQSEADCGAMEMEAIGKAAAALEASPLAEIEGLAAIRKAGRVLSSANEAKIRDAAKALGDVLASLPSAPAADTVAKEKEAVMASHTIDVRGREMAQGASAATLAKPGPVVKTAMPPEDQARNTGPVNAGGTTGMGQPRTTGPDSALPGDGPQEARPGDAPGRAVVKGALRVAVYDQGGSLAGIVDPGRIVEKVAKADSDAPPKTAMQAVFDEDGNLVGIVDPADITPVAGAGGGSSDSDGDGDGMQAGPAAAAAPADGDMTPQPPADAGTPADAVGKAADENVDSPGTEALDSIIAKAVAAAAGTFAPAQEVVARQAADLARALEEVELLKARVEVVEEHPAAPGVFTNGAQPPTTADGRPLPPPGQLRGQDQGRSAPGQINIAKAMERRKELYTAPDAATQNTIAKEMQGDAIGALQAIHAAGPSPVRLAPAELAAQ